MTGNKALPFSREGIGGLYSSTFERAFGSNKDRFPYVGRGKTLLMVADFSGQNRGQQFETYSLLFLDPDRNSDWFAQQRLFRLSTNIGRRRIAFKALNDEKRKQALVPFLRMANHIHGCLVTFAISRNSETLFERNEKGGESEKFLSIWKPKVREHVLRIAHLSAYFAAAFSRQGQDLLWFIDEDAAAANDAQLTQLTNVFSRILAHHLSHDLRHIRCGTSRSDNGSLDLEDLLAIPDLVAGATAEISTGFANQDCFPRRGLQLPLPRHLSSKTLLIASWIAESNSSLRRELFLLEPEIGQPGSRLTHCKIEPMQFT